MIKLLVPDMPTTDDLLPYLRRIDATRVYVNRGLLVQELEARLEQITGSPCVTVSNGTVALELALQALNVEPERSHFGDIVPALVIPALTFSATGLAARRAGFSVELADVDSNSWQLVADKWPEPDVEAIMPVATFGCPVDPRQWELCDSPIIIDAAGAFPSQECSKDPNIATCFSLHATKFIGCGEGGFVASANKERIEKVRSLASFGENGTNAKMSEYHAAVALASLDRMQEKLKRTHAVAKWYFQHGIADGFKTNCFGPVSYDKVESDGGSAEYRLSTIFNVLLSTPVTQTLTNKLLDEDIETKQWYRPYLDERREFGEVIEGRFPVTDHLRTHLLGLPFHNFLTEADVAHVCTTLRRLIA